MCQRLKDVTCIFYLIITQPLFSLEGTKEELSPVSHSWSVAELNLKSGNLDCTGNNYVKGVQIPLGAQGRQWFPAIQDNGKGGNRNTS